MTSKYGYDLGVVDIIDVFLNSFTDRLSIVLSTILRDRIGSHLYTDLYGE